MRIFLIKLFDEIQIKQTIAQCLMALLLVSSLWVLMRTESPKADTLNQIIASAKIYAGETATYSYTPVAGNTYSWDFADGSNATAFNSDPTTQHVYAQPGAYAVSLAIKNASGLISYQFYLQAVWTNKTAKSPSSSTSMTLETRTGKSARLWVVNPDNDAVSVIDTVSKKVVATINVDQAPHGVAIAPDGRVWVTNKESASISIISPLNFAVAQTISLPDASKPHGIAFAPNGLSALVALEATGELIKLDAFNGVRQRSLFLGSNIRHVAVNDSSSFALVSQFITPPMPGEATGTIDTTAAGGQVFVVNVADMTLINTITLKHSDKVDAEIQGSGIPNYLSSPVISPDGSTAWVPSKQDNIKRGIARSGQNLNFQNTVRAITSKIDLSNFTEVLAKRVDHDNSSVGSAAVYHPNGVFLFVALETSRQVAILDAKTGFQLYRLNVGRAPQGLSISADGNTLYVQEFMDRSVSVIDLRSLTINGKLGDQNKPITTNIIYTVPLNQEKLAPNVLLGKQLFYDAKDTRLARDSYMSCATCHNDGGQDGRIWDLTGFGEGLRNTIALNGRAGMAHGFLHWSANFDEVQDFEKQIRTLAGGSGLMTDTQFNAGTRSEALGDKKAGVSVDLDNLAAYLASLDKFSATPYRTANNTLSSSAALGKAVFQANNCASCHGGAAFTVSGDAIMLKNIGTIKTISGSRLGGALTGIDVPTLRDVWATAPYLHDGSANTLQEAVQAHTGVNLTNTDMTNLVSYLQQINGDDDASPELVTKPRNANYCAAQNKTCKLPAGANATVWFGANNKWYRRTEITGSVACNVATFGNPNAKASKRCFYSVTSTTQPATTAVWCAKQSSLCKVPKGKTATIWYGAISRWFYKINSKSIACNAASFGGDPIAKTSKACYFLIN